MATTVYKSSDTSAPALSGTVGSLIGVLDACLVNGYGSKTAAGWTKAFSGTNTASYLGTAGHYLDVNDAAAGAAGAQEATVRGYETMTAVATGTNPFPTVALQASPGLYVRKSATADSTARAWLVIADGTTFSLFVLTGDSVARYQGLHFGRFYSFKSGDTYRSIIGAHATSGASANSGFDGGSLSGSTGSGTPVGFYSPRVAAGTGTAVQDGLYGLGTNVFTAPWNGPNGADGNIYLSRLFTDDGSGNNGLRGYLRGVYQIITAFGLNDGDTFTGTGDFAGRSFVVLNRARGGAYYALETTSWDASS